MQDTTMQDSNQGKRGGREGARKNLASYPGRSLIKKKHFSYEWPGYEARPSADKHCSFVLCSGSCSHSNRIPSMLGDW